MGLLEQAAKVRIIYSADTSQAKAEIKSLRGEEKKAAQARLAEIESGNKKIKEQAEGWKNAADKIALFAGSIALAKLGLDAYAKTSDEAGKRVKNMYAGIEESMDRVLVGVGKLVIAFEPLIMAAARFAEILGDVANIAGDGWMDLADAVMAVGDPAARERLRKRHGMSVDKRTGEVYLSGARDQYIRHGGRGEDYDEQQEENRLRAGSSAAADRIRAAEQAIRNELDETVSASDAAKVRRLSARRTGKARALGVADLVGDQYTDFTSFGEGATGNSLGFAANTGPDVYGAQMTALMDKAEIAARTTNWQDRLGAARTEKANFLESTFGKLETFDGYAMAFQTLTGAVTSAMNAWIDGSMSAGKAIKLFVADTLKSVAAQMAVEALKHGAYAIGSLAWGDMKGAALHGKSAAMFAAGAAGAAIAAKSLGGSVNAPSATAPGAPTSGGSGGGGGSPDRIIVVGDHFAEQTPRARAQTARNLVSRAYAAQEEW